MAAQSLRLRLLAAATLTILLALSASGALLARLFAQHVEAREYAELRNHQNQIIAAIEVAPDGQVRLSSVPADPRFISPNGGLYWQINLADGSKQRSRSLWESELILPPDSIKNGIAHPHVIAGPNNTVLLAIERTLTVGPDADGVGIRVAVAVDRRDSDVANADFRDVLIKSLAVLGFALLGASLLQVQIGLRPLDRLRTALQSVHGGKAEKVAGDFPVEVQPLVADMNALLERERLNNQRSRERAADLAHGFKTPLAVLSTVSRELQRDGRPALAVEIDTQINIMGRHVKRELARARTVGTAAVGLGIVPVRPILEKIVAALQRISADRSLTWTIDAENDAIFSGDENDLLELVGNLAENAAKWATSHVLIRAQSSAGGLTLVVEDDGSGVPEAAHAEILVRGRRLDETADGTGLGLSIVARIVHAYTGELHIGQSTAGGLKVTIKFAGHKAS